MKTSIPVKPIPSYEITKERLNALDFVHRTVAEILIEKGEFRLVEV